MCPSFSQTIFKKEICSLFWGHRINWASCSSVYLSRTSLMTQCGITSLTSSMWQPSCSFLAWYTGSSHRPQSSSVLQYHLLSFLRFMWLLIHALPSCLSFERGRGNAPEEAIFTACGVYSVLEIFQLIFSRWCRARDRNMALCPIAFKNAYIFTGLIFISCRNRQSWTLRCYKKM